MDYTDVNRFKPGTIAYRRAINVRCVVIKTEGEFVVVRTNSNVLDKYYPQELDTEEELDAKAERQRQQNQFDARDLYGL